MRLQRLVPKIVLGIAILLILCWTLGPFYWVTISAISPRVELYAKPPHWIPQNPTLKAFHSVLIEGEGFSRRRRNQCRRIDPQRLV
jgi:multiple sugar transport system permease protein